MKGRTATGRDRRRRRILQRDGNRCVYCGATPPPELLTVDHVEPRVKGGDHSDGNLVACCVACNRAKGGSPAWAFLAERPELRANFLLQARGVWPRLRRAVEEAAVG
jgi:5-methylcytosine-specific restriction endonuclease McrA